MPPPTSQKGKYLYFAYGSNLSPTQMKRRCTANPTLSSTPLAIALLPSWRWLICEAGYANVLPPPPLRLGRQNSDDAREVPVSGSIDGVYGVLYEMDPRDELVLDGYEGVDREAGPAEEDGPVGLEIRPREQGKGDYNKWYLQARVLRWIDTADMDGEEGEEWVPVLVYVDEMRVRPSRPKTEYIGRMNRAIRECGELGVDKGWLEEVMRPVIPREN